MTQEQRDQIISRMINAPETLTEADIEAIRRDEELRDLYELSASLSAAAAPAPEYDMAKEWETFRRKMRRRPAPSRWAWVRRSAAVFLGVIVVGGLLGRVIDAVFTTDASSGQIAQAVLTDTIFATVTPELDVDLEVTEAPAPVAPSPVPSKKKLPAKTAELMTELIAEADIEEILRAQEARVQNDLALSAAQAIREEYTSNLQIYDILTETDDIAEIAILNLTMQ